MFALFAHGRLVHLAETQLRVHEYARNNPGVYQQRTVICLSELPAILTEEFDRHQTVKTIMEIGELAARQVLFPDSEVVA